MGVPGVECGLKPRVSRRPVYHIFLDRHAVCAIHLASCFSFVTAFLCEDFFQRVPFFLDFTIYLITRIISGSLVWFQFHGARKSVLWVVSLPLVVPTLPIVRR